MQIVVISAKCIEEPSIIS